jgi:dihydrofolate synthase/folylpolyglutamate synthase
VNYRETLDFLYNSLPMYQRVGRSAIKTDLTNIKLLCEELGDPQNKFKSIHIAGTNGKGSSAHMIASVLQEAGFKTGLYTSPHLKNFTERIKLNGIEIPEDDIVNFVNANKAAIDKIQPSFFEITVAMAFWFFAESSIDFAVVEVGLGGRLDSTNIIRPEVSLITNISLDHTQMLGTSIESIAYEKAGIIKEGVPVVIGEYQEESATVFSEISKERNAPILFAGKKYSIYREEILTKRDRLVLNLKGWPNYQFRNLPGVLRTLDVLNNNGLDISDKNIHDGIMSFKESTALKGRWQILNTNPLIICDTAHNEAGIKAVVEEISKIKYKKLHVVWGMVIDKAVEDMLDLLPGDAYYYFCQPDIPRAMDVEKIYSVAKKMALDGEIIEDVNDALARAVSCANEDDMIYVGGSTFVVAELKDL